VQARCPKPFKQARERARGSGENTDGRSYAQPLAPKPWRSSVGRSAARGKNALERPPVPRSYSLEDCVAGVRSSESPTRNTPPKAMALVAPVRGLR
jgi:hypothetical protein